MPLRGSPMSTSIRKHVLVAAVIGLCLGACAQDVTPEERMVRAEAALAENDNATAAIELKNLLQQQGSNVKARVMLGLIYFDRGDFLSAEKELSRNTDVDDVALKSQQQAILARTWIRLFKLDDVLAMDQQGLLPDAQATMQAASARAHMLQSDLVAAQVSIDKALALAPESSFVLFTNAQLLMLKGDANAAREQLERAERSDPDFAEVWALRGDLDLRAGDSASAEENYNKALELAPSSASYRMNRVFIRIMRNELESAQEDLDKLQRAMPGNLQVSYAQGLIYYQQRNYQEAVTSLLVAEPAKFSAPEVLRYLALAKMQLGEASEAYEFAKEYHALDEDNMVGNRLLATAALATRKFDEAEQLSRRILAEYPDDTLAMNTLASVLVGQRRADEAIELLDRVAALNPDSSEAQVRLGAGYLAAGDNEKAVQLVEGALQMDPDTGAPDVLLVYTHLRANELDEALQAAKDYVQRHPDNPGPHLVEGVVYRRIGDVSAAKAAFRKAAELQPGHPAANHQLATMALVEGDADAARGYYQQILKVHKDALAPQMAMAGLEESQGKLKDMVKWLQAAGSAHPDALQPKLGLARYWNAQKQYVKTVEVLSNLPKTLSSNPMVLREQAVAQLGQRRFQDGLASLELLDRKYELTGTDLRNMAYAQETLGQVKKAEQSLERAAELEPESIDLQLTLARFAIRGNNDSRAQGRLDKAAAIDPQNPRLLETQAALASKRGDYKRSLSLLEKAQQLRPDTANQLNLYRQYELMGDTKGARAFLERWNAEEKDNTVAKSVLAMALEKQGDVQGAVDKYREILTREPDSIVVNNNLAWLLKDSDPAQALVYARKADQVSGGRRGDIRDTLAMVLLANGELEEAKAILSKLVSASPNIPAYRYHQALVTVRSGDSARAIEQLRTLLESKDDFEQRREAEELLASLTYEQR
ncbi:MAG: XrtA/PEP-CTERM system TPR-repeat protein PrsT [Parahaliea sp.]